MLRTMLMPTSQRQAEYGKIPPQYQLTETPSASYLQRTEWNVRDSVSAILNITDGMFADFLRTHVICTINCPSSRLYPALLRPGHLVAHRNFGRLPAAQARQLAIYLNKRLDPADDYSLAEVFAGAGVREETPHLVGFAA
jgi:hypothetical protein